MPDPNAPALTGDLNPAVAAPADVPKVEQADPEARAAIGAADKAETVLAGIGEAADPVISEADPDADPAGKPDPEKAAQLARAAALKAKHKV